jgi:hypothetical protein
MSNSATLYRFKATQTDEANTRRAYRARLSSSLEALYAATQAIGADADECAAILSRDAQARASEVLWNHTDADADAVLLSVERAS